MNKKIIFVAPASDITYLISNSCIVNDLNMINMDKNILFSENVTAKFRYRQKEEPVSVKKINNGLYKIDYPHGIHAVAPGQECVFYIENECIGGATIKSTSFNGKRRVFY